jgi:Membrane bound beta barrel domain (DUF5777)
MRKIGSLLLLLTGLDAFAQDSSTTVQPKESKTPDYIWVFSSPKLINANTVEMIPAGILEFKVTHNFGDIAGTFGGIKNFFGLDAATDIRIGFQYGLSKRFNLVAARAKGAGNLKQLYELGVKYRLLQQANDGGHPLSIALFGNVVACAMEADTIGNKENSFEDFSDRLSQTLQLLIARKFGKISLQINPTMVHTNYVVPGDDNTIFSLGGALRVPVMGRFSVLFDYFHSFRSQESIDAFEANNIKFYDAMGIGVEFLTEGHVFHLNFTNSTEILENRFIPRTTTSWSKGQYRWGFTVSRDFDLLWKKKHRKK